MHENYRKKAKNYHLFKKKESVHQWNMPIMQSPKLSVFVVCVPEFNSLIFYY